LALPLAAESFDVVLANATLHHLGDTAAALERLGELVRPGGRLAVVTFVRPRVIDLPWQAVAALARWFVTRSRGQWPHTAPMMGRRQTRSPPCAGQGRQASPARTLADSGSGESCSPGRGRHAEELNQAPAKSYPLSRDPGGQGSASSSVIRQSICDACLPADAGAGD
jgi:SAM-dependent methyltransferase